MSRPVGYVGILLGGAAAALIFGAGVAQADEGAPSSDKASESSASSEPNTAAEPSKTETETGPKTKTETEPTMADATPPTSDDATPQASSTISSPSTSVVTRTVTIRKDDDKTTAVRDEPKTEQPAEKATLEAVATQAETPKTLTAAAETKTSLVTAAPQPPHLQQFVRQLTGLGVDVAALSASFVSNLAMQVAYTLPPGFLGGGPHYTALTIANFAADVSRQLTGAPPNTPSAGPFPVTYGVFDPLAWLNPNAIPAGANDPTITVTPARPLPVILINGTTETSGFNWSVGAPVLANAGYKVYTFGYGASGFPIGGVGDIAKSAQELSDQIDAVLKETKADKVILVGHSQGGGILPAYYMNVMGGAANVSQLIGIAPSNHGTDVNQLAYALALPILGPLLTGLLGATLPALEQQSITSPFQQLVYGNGDTRPGVLYTTIVSTYDEVLTPYPRQFLNGPNVTNVVLQDQNPGFLGGHLSVLVNPAVWSTVLDALSNNPAANPLLAPLVA